MSVAETYKIHKQIGITLQPHALTNTVNKARSTTVNNMQLYPYTKMYSYVGLILTI